MSGNPQITEPKNATGKNARTEDLRVEFYGALEALSKSAQSMSSMLVQIAALGGDFGLDATAMMPVVEAVDELARRVADLRPPEEAWQ